LKIIIDFILFSYTITQMQIKHRSNKMSAIKDIINQIKPIPTIILTKENAIKIIKSTAQKGMCYMKSLIMPEVAKELLKLEGYNRKRKISTVKTYARYMVIGKWKLIPDPISFDTTGKLTDGGHSLSSVVESNVPSMFVICSGAPRDSQEATDQILPRTALDVVEFQDKKYRGQVKSIHPAVIRSMLVESPASLRIAVPKLEMAEFIKTYFDSVNKVVSFFGSGTRNGAKIRNSSIMAPVVRAYEIYKSDSEKIKRLGRFVGIIIGAIRSEKPEDDAAYKLREWILLELGSTKTRPYKRVIYRKTEKALKLFLTGDTCSSLMESNMECFPLDMTKHENLTAYLDNSKSMEKKHGNKRRTRKKNVSQLMEVSNLQL